MKNENRFAYTSIFVLGELCPHLQDLMVVDLLDEVAHFVALLQAEGVVIPIADEVLLRPQGFEVVHNFSVKILQVKRCVELDNDWCSTAKLRLNVSLDVDHLVPVFVSSALLKCGHESCVVHDANDVRLMSIEVACLILEYFLSDQGNVLVVRGLVRCRLRST